MKRCPECRRDYYDDTLLYCLDDGNALLEGPARDSRAGDEPATAILTGIETPTRPLVQTTDETALLSKADETGRNTSQQKKKVTEALVVFVCVLAAVGIGFAIYKYNGSKKAELSLESAKIDRVTSTGKTTIASIAPDGKYIVHVVDDAGKQSLWVRQTLTGSNVQIVPPAEISYRGITFSPDGNFVFYVARDVGKGVGLLYRVPVLGGTPVTLVNDVDSPIAISTDGTQMVFLRWTTDKDRLLVANIDGTAERELTSRDKPERLIGGPAWSPDGKMVVCPLQNREATSLLRIRITDGAATPLTQKSWDAVGQVTWFNSDTIMLNALDRNSNSGMQIWSLSLSDNQTTPITRDLNNYRGVSLSADSNTLVTVQSNTQSNVSLAQAGDEVHSKELTSGKSSVTDLSWTADGRIYYDSNANGNWDIFSINTDGTNQQQVTTDPKSDYDPLASPDGRYIVFLSNRTGSSELWRMNSDGKNPIRLTTGGGVPGSFTPDGKWFLYSSGHNASRIFKISIDGGEAEPVGDGTSVYQPVVSPDGQTIAYWSYVGVEAGGGYVFKIMPLSGGPAINTFELPPTASRSTVHFNANGQSLFYTDTQNGVSNIWSQPVGGGKPKQITNFKTGTILTFAYSPDEKQLAYIKGETTNDVVMISGIRK